MKVAEDQATTFLSRRVDLRASILCLHCSACPVISFKLRTPPAPAPKLLQACFHPFPIFHFFTKARYRLASPKFWYSIALSHCILSPPVCTHTTPSPPTLADATDALPPSLFGQLADGISSFYEIAANMVQSRATTPARGATPARDHHAQQQQHQRQHEHGQQRGMTPSRDNNINNNMNNNVNRAMSPGKNMMMMMMGGSQQHVVAANQARPRLTGGTVAGISVSTRG